MAGHFVLTKFEHYFSQQSARHAVRKQSNTTLNATYLISIQTQQDVCVSAYFSVNSY